MGWPATGGELSGNVWHSGLVEFIQILDSVKDERWWIVDTELKYINIRVDTRTNHFIVGIDDSDERIDPQRVVDAIETYKAKYMNGKRA